MSYSFSVAAPSKAEAKEQVVAKFDEMVVSQPTHAADREVALANANAVIDLLQEPVAPDQVRVSCSGYLSWRSTHGDPPVFTSANVSASASLAP